MMRLFRFSGFVVASTVVAVSFAQAPVGSQAQNPATRPAQPGKQQQLAQRAPQQPFPPLTAAAQQRLDQLLAAWENSSQGTKRLQANFKRWQFRPLQAPGGVHATWSQGEVKYEAPAKGLFRVDEMLFFNGLDEAKKPIYKKEESNPGEWWVCTGKELMEFDRSGKKCEILELPPQMQGKAIVSSPLPFVFNLNAAEMKQRYWLRELPPQQEGEFWLEAWPKNQQDRAEFLKVVIVIKADVFLPKALVMFPPNFDERTNPERDVYEFADVKRNGGLLGDIFFRNFFDEKPPSGWKVLRNKFTPPVPPQMAQQPQGTPTTR